MWREALYGPVGPTLAKRAGLIGGALQAVILLLAVAILATSGVDLFVTLMALLLAVGATSLTLLALWQRFPIGASWRYVGLAAGFLVMTIPLWVYRSGVVATVALAYCVALLPVFVAARLSVLRDAADSGDDVRARARVERAVDRGEQMSTEWEARMAVEVASQKLEKLRGQRRMTWVVAAMTLIWGLGELYLGRPLLAVPLLALSVLTVGLGLPLLSRYVQPRLERARTVNEELLRSRAAPE